MRKRGLALILAACVLAGTVMGDTGGVSVSAAQVAESEAAAEMEETPEAGELEIEAADNSLKGLRESGGYKYEVLQADGTVCIFGYTGNDTDLVIPAEIDGKKVTEIGTKAFYGCKNLNSVIIPEGVTAIDMYAFAFCNNLSSVTIPKSNVI